MEDLLNNIILPLITSFIITYLSIPKIIHFSKKVDYMRVLDQEILTKEKYQYLEELQFFPEFYFLCYFGLIY